MRRELPQHELNRAVLTSDVQRIIPLTMALPVPPSCSVTVTDDLSGSRETLD
jgi:hypothetical protein